MAKTLFNAREIFTGAFASLILLALPVNSTIARDRRIAFQSNSPGTFLEDQRQCSKALRVFGIASPRKLSEAEHNQFYQAWDLAEKTYGPQSKEARDLFQLYALITEQQPNADLGQPFLLKVTSSSGAPDSRDHLNEWSQVLRKRTPLSLKAILASAAAATLITPPAQAIHHMMGDPIFSLSSAVAVVGSTLLISKGLESKVVNSNNRFLAQAERILSEPHTRHTAHLQWRVRMPALDLLDDLKKRTSPTTFYHLSEWIYAQQSLFVEVIFDHNMAVDPQGSPQFVNAVRIAPASEQNP